MGSERSVRCAHDHRIPAVHCSCYICFHLRFPLFVRTPHAGPAVVIALAMIDVIGWMKSPVMLSWVRMKCSFRSASAFSPCGDS